MLTHPSIHPPKRPPISPSPLSLSVVILVRLHDPAVRLESADMQLICYRITYAGCSESEEEHQSPTRTREQLFRWRRFRASGGALHELARLMQRHACRLDYHRLRETQVENKIKGFETRQQEPMGPQNGRSRTSTRAPTLQLCCLQCFGREEEKQRMLPYTPQDTLIRVTLHT